MDWNYFLFHHTSAKRIEPYQDLVLLICVSLDLEYSICLTNATLDVLKIEEKSCLELDNYSMRELNTILIIQSCLQNESVKGIALLGCL